MMGTSALFGAELLNKVEKPANSKKAEAVEKENREALKESVAFYQEAKTVSFGASII